MAGVNRVVAPRSKALDEVAAALREGRPVRLGKTWRLRAGGWPTPTDRECIIFEHFYGSQWKLVAVLQPSGIWGSEP